MALLAADPVTVLPEQREPLEQLVRTHSTPGSTKSKSLVRKLLRRGNFSSKTALRTKIEEFIAYFNRTMAKPFR